jgi:serine/threonine-protein kinase
MVLLPLLGLLAGAGIAAALFQALAGDGPGAPAVAADQEQVGTTVTIDAADYIGRPVDEVVDELTALGLDVERRQFPTEDAVPGSVTDVAPDGVLQPEDTVVVSYAVAPGTGATRQESGVTGAAVEPADETSSSATTTEEAQPTDAATAGATSELPGGPVETGVVTEPTETTTPTEPTSTGPTTSETTTSETTTSETTTSETSGSGGQDVNTVNGGNTAEEDD